MARLFSKKRKILIWSLVLLLLFTVVSLSSHFLPIENKIVETASGSNADRAHIYIRGENQGYASGGLISLASTDEPAVRIGVDKISGIAEVSMYEANEDALIDYLTHDKEGKQIKKDPDTNGFRYIVTVKENINHEISGGTKVILPLEETGIWYLKIKLGSIDTNAFILRSNFGVLLKEGKDEFIFWGQDFKTKRSISDGTIKLLNLRDGRRELQASNFNTEGIAMTNLNAEADIALVQRGDDKAIVPINLRYLNADYSYQTFQPDSRQVKHFIFTDRPLYKPGDTVYFKTVSRDDDDARYTIPAGQALVKIYNGYYYSGSNSQSVFEKSYPISANGIVSGEYKIPDKAKTDNYTLIINLPGQAEGVYGSTSFDVQFFRKPEFSIDVTTPKTELIAGDKTSFKINGSYFSGQPLLNQKVKYMVRANNFHEYQYLIDRQRSSYNLSNDYRYGYQYGDNTVVEGVAILDKNGEAEIDLDTKMDFNEGKSQVFSIEAAIDDESQNPSFSRKNILVYAGEYGIYRKDYSYGSKINTPLSLPVTLIPYRDNSNVANIKLTAKVHRENWVSYQEENKKYPSYRKEEEDLPSISATTDSQGNATFSFAPTKIGSYTITAEGKDTRGNFIAKKFYSYVSADDQPYFSEGGNNDLTIATDKQEYQPDSTVSLNIYSAVSNRDIFLSLERGRLNRFQIVHLNGKNGTVEVPLVNTDIPNIYAKASSFSAGTLNSNQAKIIVSTDGKKLIVNISPNSKTFDPGETATVNVQTTDIGGNPVSAEVALWAVDKAIFELSDNRLGDIFKTFWNERYNSTQSANSLEGILIYTAERGGCFGSETPVLMANGKMKNIEDIKVGDYILTRTEIDQKLVKAKVLKTHSVEEEGYLILNKNLKVTPSHIMRVNNSWRRAGSIQIGDVLVNNQASPVRVESIEWQREKAIVYNLEVEKYHSYFAGEVWVHNGKDGGGGRSVFKDTAYWNPSIYTDNSGRAQVSFKIPDNLTTWTIAAVGSTLDTRVGQTTDEIVVTKDLIIRPILPNILRVDDEIYISALVQNFTNTDQTFDIDLQFNAGEVKQAKLTDILIKSNEMERVYWKVLPNKKADKAKFIFSVHSQDNEELSDIITQEVPVYAFGFEEKRVETGEGVKDFSIKLAPDSNKDESKITLSLAPTIIGTLPTAMNYLIKYPYGCTEQTTSRFVPAVIAKENQNLFADALKDKDINDILEKSILKLSELQRGSGGWAWWSSGDSDPFVTAYVVDYLLQAKRIGVEVDDKMLSSAQRYLEQDKERENKKDKIARTYALTLLNSDKRTTKLDDLDNLSPDLLSLAVMTNYLNGNKNSQTNGLDRLISMAQAQGDAVFWEAGDKIKFGSRGASTALAIRAILASSGDRSLAAKGVRYLARNRQSDYWSNTFATAQVIRALVDFLKTESESTPSYNYIVSLDDEEIARGTVVNPKLAIKDISIPTENIKPNGSKISISKTGEGQLYSTLTINEFRTDKKAKAVDRGLSVKREYINEKGSQYTLGVGDIALVKITISGLKADEHYGIINDELPSGLVPINPKFKNEQYKDSVGNDYNNLEVTENGMILSPYQMNRGERTYIYRARVVNDGRFIVPPVAASLMYAPEIYGRSEAQMVRIDRESRLMPGKAVNEALLRYDRGKLMRILLSVLLVAIGVLVLRRRGITWISLKEKIRQIFKRNKKESHV